MRKLVEADTALREAQETKLDKEVKGVDSKEVVRVATAPLAENLLLNE
jgi:hypothetical protein